MKEIAERSQANTGSLCRFFPSEESLGEARMLRYSQLVAAQFDRIDTTAKSGTLFEVADLLVDFMVEIHHETTALIALLDARSDWSSKRQELRNEALRRIAAILRARAPQLDRKTAADMAIWRS